jgi:glycosyltransferase involved in cell wall biosynthesis
MRVLTITNLYPNPYEPTRATFNRQQVRSLARRHAVRVISPIAWTEELAARRAGQPPLPRGRRVTCDGITVDHPLYLYTPKLLRGWYGQFYRRSVEPSFKRALEEFNPDVVFAPWAYPDGWAAVELARQAGLPAVIKVHGCDVLAEGRGLQPGSARHRRTADALRGADAVIAVSQDLASHVVDLGVDKSRVRVVYDGIDTDLFNPAPAAEARQRLGLGAGGEPVVLFVGNLVSVKNVEALIDACGLMAKASTPFRCFIIGKGALREDLEARAAALGLGERVKFMGSRPHEQLPDWYRAADVFVLPSWSEGVPCVLLESLACGTPFVASRVGGIPEIAGRGASRLVPPGDARQLAGAITEVISQSHAGRNGHRTAGWDRGHDDAAAEIAGIFEEAMAVRRPRVQQMVSVN